MYFMTIWFKRERGEAQRSAASVGLGFSSMVKYVVENGMEAVI
jgi:hypothetical protein